MPSSYSDRIADSFPGKTVGFEKVSVPNGGTASLNPPPTARGALVTVEDNDIRFRTDGTNPNSTTGHTAPKGTQFFITTCDDLVGFRAFGVGASASTLQVSYYE